MIRIDVKGKIVVSRVPKEGPEVPGIRLLGGIFGRMMLVFRATGRTFPWHAMRRFQGGERDCTVQQFENATPGNCDHLPAGGAFLCSTKMCA
jgi:hypothetical protein